MCYVPISWHPQRRNYSLTWVFLQTILVPDRSNYYRINLWKEWVHTFSEYKLKQTTATQAYSNRYKSIAYISSTVHSHVLEAFKLGHRGGDFTIEVVAGEIEFHELGKLANLCWDWPSYVVALQQTAKGETTNSHHSSEQDTRISTRRTHHSQRLKTGQVPYSLGEVAREIAAWSFPAES